jgi:hypothetical protein
VDGKKVNLGSSLDIIQLMDNWYFLFMRFPG